MREQYFKYLSEEPRLGQEKARFFLKQAQAHEGLHRP